MKFNSFDSYLEDTSDEGRSQSVGAQQQHLHSAVGRKDLRHDALKLGLWIFNRAVKFHGPTKSYHKMGQD